jgi:hypothetical protein
MSCFIRLFDGQRTVHTALLECSLPEVTTLEAVTWLYAQPVLSSEEEEEPFSEAFEATGPSRAA